MAKLEPSVIEKYQSILAKDPSSQVFAPLAEAYREMGMLKEASQIVTAGVQRHPQFVGGLITFAKILREAQQIEKALESLKKATELAPENVLAHQLTAELQLELKNPKDALKSFKMILFLNPTSHSAQRAIQKLEALTADEYEDEVFSMKRLPDINWETPTPSSERLDDLASLDSSYRVTPPTRDKAFERMLSLIDAFIVRNDLDKAQALLNDTAKEFGEQPELEKRRKSLKIRNNESDEPVNLKPLRKREDLIQEQKLITLRLMLRNIQEYSAQG
jgi:tetratricopeptide (TPR) repeat protein